MHVSSVTVGVPVGDLPAAVAWYRRVFELPEPELEPAEGVVEFQVGPVWLQLMSGAAAARVGPAAVLRVGVADAAHERDRLSELGLDVGRLVHVEGAVDYVDFADPDGNQLSVYSLAEPQTGPD